MGQNTVFEQVIKLISRKDFEKYVSQYNGNKRTRSLDCWTWFGALLFGQMTGHDSIRAIERVFCNSNNKFKKLGFTPIRRSTFADANSLRPLAILECTLKDVIGKAKLICSNKHDGK